MKTERPSLKELARKVIDQAESAKSEDQQLDESKARLENLSILVSIDPDRGSERIVIADTPQANTAIVAGDVIYTPAEMRLYVRLSPDERRLVRELKANRQKGVR